MAIWERFKGNLFDTRYEFHGLLGEGSWGEVASAFDRVRAQEVAVKLLKDRPGRDALADRFFRSEFRAMASIEHPNIVRVLDFGQSSEGIRYYSMEVVPGKTLSSCAGAIRGKQFKQVFEGLCRALEAVHVRGCLHCDVKPDNVKVIVDGSDLKPILMDFGLNIGFTSSAASSPRGTPLYAAPEMLAGMSVDARADIYSLGMTLLETLVGKLPFTGKGIKSILYEKASRGSQLPLTSEIPDDYRDLITRMIAPDPRDRFPSCSAILADMAARSGGKMEMPPPPEPPQHLLHPDLIGREGLQQLIQMRIDLLQKGAGGLVLIDGSSKSGKSRLLQEARYQGQLSGAKVLYWGGTARSRFPKFSDMLDEHLDIGDEKPRGGAYGELVVRRIIESSRERPLMIIADDIDMMRSDDAALWHALAFRSLTESYLVLSSTTTRHLTEDSQVSTLIATAGDSPEFIRLKLGSLNIEQLAELYKSMLGTSDDVSGLVRLTMSRTGGNVGASVELLDELAKAKCLKHDVGEWSVTSLAHFDSLRRKKAVARLDVNKLPSELRDILICAAIHGAAAPTESVRQLIGLGAGEFAAGVMELEKSGILVLDAFRHTSNVRFENAELPALILREADPERVQLLSSRIADILLSSRAEGSEFDALMLVESLVRAGRRKEAMELAVEEILENRDKRDHWVNLSMMKLAIELLRQSRPPNWTTISEIEQLMARGFTFHGDREAGLKVCMDSIADMEEAGLDERSMAQFASPLLREAGLINEDWGNYEAGIELYKRALVLLEPFAREETHYPFWIPLRHELSWLELLAGNVTESAKSIKELLDEKVENLLPDDEIMIRHVAGSVCLHQGQAEEALRHFLEGYAVSVRNGLIENSKFLPTKGAARALRHLGRWEEALSYAKEECRIAEITRFALNKINSLISIAKAEIELGTLRSAEVNLRNSIQLAGEHGLITSYIAGLPCLGRVLMLQGKGEEAHQILMKARNIAEKHHFQREIMLVELALADLMMDDLRPDVAEKSLKSAIRIAKELRDENILPDLYLRMARLALLLKARQRFSYYIKKCEARARTIGSKHILNLIEREWALYYAQQGNSKTAHDLFEFAIKSFSASGARFEESITRLRWAEFCLDDGNISRVESLIQGLEDVFDEAGAERERERAVALRRRIAQDRSYSDKVLCVLDAFEKVRFAQDMDSALDSILRTMVTITGADRGLVIGFNSRGMIQFEAATNFSAAPQQHASLSTSILNFVKGSGEPLLLKSALSDPRFMGSSSIVSFQLGSVICVPVFASGNLQGVLYADSKEPDVFSENEHLPLARIIAHHLGLLMDYSRMRKESELIEELVASLTHEMRTPLTTIQYCLEEISANGVDRSNRNRDVANGQVKRLSRLTEETLDLIRHKNASKALKMDRIDVNALIKHTADALRAQTSDKEIDLRLELSEGLPRLDAIGDSLEQVLINLVGNATKFTDPGGVVRISSGMTDFVQDPSLSASSCLYMNSHDKFWKGSFVTIAVEDNGRGMDPAACRRIFDKYVRLEEKSLASVKGAGLGLYISRNIIEQHGGRIWANSEIGKGTRVTFTLPLPLPPN
ncbi:MAG: protein kinase [Candidatus Coatesbacteria bacterium]|nr:protein kinase [Candidatus Coatesbacteria bacterium]